MCNADNCIISDGPAHRHRGKVPNEKVLVFFMEKV
jgi:hypothetical protein